MALNLSGGFIALVLGWLILRVAYMMLDLANVVDAGTPVGFAIGVRDRF
jgi:hypothetical protein